MNRAIGKILYLRQADEETRTIEGIASTPVPDRFNDVLDPLGVSYSLPIPLLWQHKADEPVGSVERVSRDAHGIAFRARIARVDEPGRVHDRLEECWQSIKAGLVRGISVGFRPIERELRDGGKGWVFSRWEWLELSAVTVPANGDCSITSIKAFDAEQRLANLPAVRVVKLADPLPGVRRSCIWK